MFRVKIRIVVPESIDYEALDPGYTVLERRPAMRTTQEAAEARATAAIDPLSARTINDDGTIPLAYCELRVDAKSIGWWFVPKYGVAEEYTACLSREDLEGILNEVSA